MLSNLTTVIYLNSLRWCENRIINSFSEIYSIDNDSFKRIYQSRSVNIYLPLHIGKDIV